MGLTRINNGMGAMEDSKENQPKTGVKSKANLDLDETTSKSSSTECNTIVSNVAPSDSQTAPKVSADTDNPPKSNGLSECKENHVEPPQGPPGGHHFGVGSDSQCTWIMDSGEPCRAAAVKGSSPPRCLFHSTDEDLKAKAQEARIRGGLNRGAQPVEGWSPKRIDDPEALRKTLEAGINGLLSRELGAREASALSSLCGRLLQVIEVQDLRRRVEAIEDALESKGNR